MIIARKMFCSCCGVSEDVYATERETTLIFCKDCHDIAREHSEDFCKSLDRIFFVADRGMGALDKAFAKIARRAKRIGVDAPTYKVVGNPIFEEYTHSPGGSKPIGRGDKVPKTLGIRKLNVIQVNPNRSRVKIDGYAFVATIELGPEGNLIRGVPGEYVPQKFRACSNECEHCHTSRGRKEVFVLRKESDNSHIQIGRNCCVEFLGVDALSYADRAEYYSTIDETLDSACDDDDNEERASGGKEYVRADIFLGYCAEVINLKGWISRAQTRDNGGEATADTAAKHYWKLFSPREVPLFRSVSPESQALADAALSWAESIEGEDVSDYLHNLRVLALRGYLSMRDLGIAASMIQAYSRNLHKAETRASKAESQYIGNIGDKLTISITVHKVITMDGQYGTSHLHILSDACGNKLKYFSSSLRLDEGSTHTLKGTIKAHDEYRNERQTILTRCSIVEYRAFYSPCTDALIIAESEKDAATMLRLKLGTKKLSKGQSIHEFSLMSA